MVLLIAGPSHVGKTLLAQRFLEKYHVPYLSLDHLKMGLIRSGHTSLTPMSSDAELTGLLWPIAREMIKTALENRQEMIVEGCYVPADWEKDFGPDMRDQIRCIRLIMSEGYVRRHFSDICAFASVIEDRLDDGYCTMEAVLEDNRLELERCLACGAEYHLIDSAYDPETLLDRPEYAFG